MPFSVPRSVARTGHVHGWSGPEVLVIDDAAYDVHQARLCGHHSGDGFNTGFRLIGETERQKHRL